MDESKASKHQPYEDVPYRGFVVPNTSPGHLTVCSLWHHGPRPASQKFRLAELGCGDAANLLPLAFHNRESSFIGIDNSQEGLDQARWGAACLGLENIQFLERDVCDLEPREIAPCDYIIGHGLYSWVPDDARDAIRRICGQCLTPSGLAYLSYNAQPGWTVRRSVREMLRRATSVRDAGVEEKAMRAIEVAEQLLEDLQPRDDPDAVFLADELERVRDGKSFYVFHEYLAEVNDGFWLRDFVESVRRNGLDYVADAQFGPLWVQVPPEYRVELARKGLAPLEQEEAADRLCHRYFRASILCRADAPREWGSKPDLLEEVYLATHLRAESDPFDIADGVEETFRLGRARAITLDASVTKAAVLFLANQWPMGHRLEGVYQQASQLLAAHGCEVTAEARSRLSADLVSLVEAGQINIRSREPSHSQEIPEYPRAHALARFEAEHGETLTTSYHLTLSFDRRVLDMVAKLDGSKSQAELRTEFGRETVDEMLPVVARGVGVDQ